MWEKHGARRTPQPTNQITNTKKIGGTQESRSEKVFGSYFKK